MKKTILSIGLCIALLFSGCAQKSGLPAKTASAPLPGGASDVAQPAESGTVPPVAAQANWGSIEGKIQNLIPAGGGKVLLFADQMTLYDLAEGKPIASAAKESLAGVRCWVLNSGYAIAGEKKDEGTGSAGFIAGGTGPEFCIIFYDATLKKSTELDFAKLLGDEEFLTDTSAVAISSDGTRVAYATLRGLYLYDLPSGQRTTLVDLAGEDDTARAGLSIIEQIGFTNSDNSIAFKAQSFDTPAILDKPSFDTVGTVHTDGTGLTNQKVAGYSTKELTAYPGRLLVAEDFTTADGRAMVMDSNGGDHTLYRAAKNDAVSRNWGRAKVGAHRAHVQPDAGDGGHCCEKSHKRLVHLWATQKKPHGVPCPFVLHEYFFTLRVRCTGQRQRAAAVQLAAVQHL